MKRKISIPLVLFIFLFLPFWKVSAHGGFQKITGNTVVSVTQDPISPLIGEDVKMYFNLKDQSIKSNNLSDQNLVNYPLELSVINTYLGDSTKDQTILTKDFKTDENGNFNFDYTFYKENYYDVEIRFKDREGMIQDTGFLVQPRKTKLVQVKETIFSPMSAVIFFALGFLTSSAGLIILYKKRRK